MIFRRTRIALLAPVALLASCGLAPQEKLAEAEASYLANDFAGAKVYLVSALRDMPGDPAMLTLLAKTQIAMGDGEGAFATLQQVARGDREDREYRALLAEAELLRGNFTQALAIVDDPTSAEESRIAALAHLGLGDLERALSAISLGRGMKGNKAPLLSVLARIKLAQSDAPGALRTSDLALEADGDDIDALLASARAYQASYDLPKSLSAYAKAAKLYPQNVAAHLGHVATLAEMGQLDKAKSGLLRLEELAPRSIEVTHLKARIALEEEDWPKAREILQGNETAIREHPRMQASYAEALLRVGQAGQARAWLEPLVEDFPGMREPRTLLAEAQFAEGLASDALATIRPLAQRPDARPEELAIAAKAARASGDAAATRYAKRASSSTPEWIGGELAKADMALRNRQWRKAIESYEVINARTSTPNAMVLNNLAFAKSQLGETEDAIRIALEAVQIAPDHPAVLDTAGWLMVQSGEDRKRGLELLEKASRLDPDNVAIAGRLARAKAT